MPQRRFEWHERIKAVEREYWAVKIAVERLSMEVAHDPLVLGDGPGPRDLETASQNLEGTYLVRMFSEFETGVRSFWRTVKPRAHTPAEILLARVGSRCSIPNDVIRNAQDVRAYRNMLVHERDEKTDAVAIVISRRSLATYLARLPVEWAG
jgi:hypothetical protein